MQPRRFEVPPKSYRLYGPGYPPRGLPAITCTSRDKEIARELHISGRTVKSTVLMISDWTPDSPAKK